MLRNQPANVQRVGFQDEEQMHAYPRHSGSSDGRAGMDDEAASDSYQEGNDDMQFMTMKAMIGFGGGVPGGLHLHPDGNHMIYALGASIVIREVGNSSKTEFLYGHNDTISCVAVSRSGRYIASGQITPSGFQAPVLIFDFEKRKLVHRMQLHKEKVKALAFSKDESLLASIGGEDDKTIVVWDVEVGRPVGGSVVRNDTPLSLCFLNNTNTQLLMGGMTTLRLWEINLDSHKMSDTVINMGKLRRSFTTVVVEATDMYAYCGTTTGDVACVQLQRANVFKMNGPQKNFSQGIVSTILDYHGNVVVGSGAGEVAVLSKIDLTIQKSTVLQGGATSLAAIGPHYFVGTDKSNIYYISEGNFREELRQTCPYQRVNDVVFPSKYSALFATCSGSDIRLWNTSTCAEVLRIQVGQLECNCMQFTKDGRMIVSGWNDGKLRGFGPQSGKLIFAVNDAHKVDTARRMKTSHIGVTAVSVGSSSELVVTGGSDGLVRVWRLQGRTCTLEASMKEHKGTINDIKISSDDTECVSACEDSCCIIWDLTRCVRRSVAYSQCYFRAVAYFPDESQIITTGSDKRISYWDAVDCSVIRELEGSSTGEINSLSMSEDGTFFATGGNDRVVKVWGYDEGKCVAVGTGHSCNITKVVVSPDSKSIVSVSDDGSIMVWEVGSLDIQVL